MNVNEPSPLAIYLNDHLAGGTGAIEMVDRAARDHAGEPLGDFCANLAGDIKADHETLQRVMEAVGAQPNPLKQVGAKVMEKISRFKLSGGGVEELAVLLTLETLSLGIEGKACLWQSMKLAAEGNDALKEFDFDELHGRARDQRSRVEEERLRMAKQALSAPASV